MKLIAQLSFVAILVALAVGQTLPEPGQCGVFEKSRSDDTRIVGGQSTVPNSRPYQGLLVVYADSGAASSYCGCTLITETHVLTAAHCVSGQKPTNVQVHFGIHNFTNDLLSKDKGVFAQSIFVHESYDANSLNNDVAVLRLASSIKADKKKVGLICLANNSDSECKSDTVYASGWGATTGNRSVQSRPLELQEVTLACVDDTNKDCKSLTYVLGIFKRPSQMCAYAQNKGVCFGDSGGPLVRERVAKDGTVYLQQVGIMSGTIDCSLTAPKPDVYANVRYLNSWIVDKVKNSP